MTVAMKPFITLVCAALLGTGLHAQEELSSADREALLEKLENMKNRTDATVEARFRVALAAYRKAMTSNQTAMDFYLKCIEKVDFEDQKLKNSDFREWKRQHSDRLSDGGFKLALRYQLQWLILTLRATPDDVDRQALAAEAQGVVNSIFMAPEKLKGHNTTLGQSVTSTVFARAYDIGNVKVEDWCQSPVRLDAIYDKIILPFLRQPKRVDKLRDTWLMRIKQEGIMVEEWSGDGKERKNSLSSDPRSVQYEKFLAETVPELQWQMEVDVFRAGDERSAALRMLAHIEKYITHKSAPKWGNDFKNLLRPPVVQKVTTQVDP